MSTYCVLGTAPNPLLVLLPTTLLVTLLERRYYQPHFRGRETGPVQSPIVREWQILAPKPGKPDLTSLAHKCEPVTSQAPLTTKKAGGLPAASLSAIGPTVAASPRSPGVVDAGVASGSR